MEKIVKTEKNDEKNKKKEEKHDEEQELEEPETHSLVKINVRGITTKVRKSRTFVVKDLDYFDDLFKFLQPRYAKLLRALRMLLIL